MAIRWWDDLDDDQEDDELELPSLVPRATGGRALAERIAQSRPEWFRRAACRGATSVFFPAVGETTDAARKVCADCEVRGQCEAFALANGERFGIWGGLSAVDRGRVLRAQGGRRRGLA